jgi:general secretion pathway protein N
MSSRSLIALFVAAAMVMTVALAPMSLLTAGLKPAQMVGIGAVSGVVWRGRFERVAFAGAPIGTWTGGINGLALLTGKLRMALAQDRAGSPQRVVLLLRGHERGVERLALRTSLELTPLGLPLTADIAARDLTAVFRNGRCARAAGDVRLRLLGEGPLGGATLSGASVCRADAWLAVLSGRAGAADLKLVGRVEGDGRYQLEMSVVTADPDLIQALLASGFSRDATGARRTVDGRLWGASGQEGMKRSP